MEKRKDKIIKKVNVKENQVLEIRPPKDCSIFYRFEMQPISRISKIMVYVEKTVPAPIIKSNR